jgi:hypothetical protein
MTTRHHRVLRALLLGFALINAVWVQAAQSPQVKQPPVDTPKRILFIGNSYFYYNDSLHNHVRRLRSGASLIRKRCNTITPLAAHRAHHNLQYLLAQQFGHEAAVTW